jgi:small-conductance mechanosensitive channel
MTKYMIKLLLFACMLCSITSSAQDSLVKAVDENITLVNQTHAIWVEAEQYWQNFLEKLPMIGIGLILLIAFILIARPLSQLLVRPITTLSSSLLIKVVARRLVSVLIILFGFYLFLRFAGLSEFAIAILSGTGVLGLIIGFAFKDIAENFISSLLLSVQKPFKIDDVIEIDGRIGVVKQVTARATTLVDFNGDHIQIPNATVYKNVIRNLTANPKSRGQFIIGIGYDSSIVQAQQLAIKVLDSTDAVLADPEPQVLVDILASSTVNLKVYFWVDTHQHSINKVASFLMRTIMREFEHQGISMPDDAREIIFPEGIVLHRDTDASNVKANTNSLKQAPEQQQNLQVQHDLEHDAVDDDLTSDADNIRQQAKAARDPEMGANIL